MPYLLGLFHWGACRVSKLRGNVLMSKKEKLQIDRIVWEMHAMSSFGLYAHVPTAYSLRRNHPKLAFYGQWVPTRAYIHKRKCKTSHSMHFPLNPISFATFPFLYCPQYSPYTRPSETILTNRASIERQINRLSRDI